LRAGVGAAWLLSVVVAGARAEPPNDAAERPTLQDLLDFSNAPTDVRRTLFRVQALEQRGRGGEALAVLRNHITRHPDGGDPLIRFHLGRLLAERGETAGALDPLRAAVAAEPRLWPAWRALGQAAYLEGRYEEAANAFLQAFRREPEPPAALAHYAAAGFLQAGAPQRARPLLEDLLSGRYGTPEPTWFRTYLAVVMELERPELATPAIRELVRLYPNLPEAWQLASQQAAACGDFERATVALQTLSFLRPLDREETLRLGDLYRAVGVPAVAARYYAALLAQRRDPDVVERLVTALVAAHEPDSALAALAEPLAEAPSARLWCLAGDIHYQQAAYDRARGDFERALALDPDLGRAHLMLGYCAWELHDRATAVRHLQAAERFPPQRRAAEEALRTIGEP
jgi:tetratricopeptide (TPR) repeat protein